ncbi:MAG: peptide chain release factor N(5)-glutamine methyltransferase [Victivallales bacterium]|nr:peptide chain release factor N(5)-glutamine methyltransferase [Victivallales bacterium]
MRAETMIADAGQCLVDAGISNGRQEARWIMGGIVSVLSPCCGGCELSVEVQKAFEKQVERRVQGEPLQYVMGSAAFHCIELAVGPGVLIPRPETEQLVELALKQCPANAEVLDLCTGSGAIALAMAMQRPNARFTGVDISEEALCYARQNKSRLGTLNVEFLQGDLFAPLPAGTKYTLVTANPPYVSEKDYDNLEPVVRVYEPRQALLAEENGLAVLRRIAEGVGRVLVDGGFVISEIGDEQGRAVKTIFQEANLQNVQVLKDYSEKDRFVVAVKG